jgi:hypothetical protein
LLQCHPVTVDLDLNMNMNMNMNATLDIDPRPDGEHDGPGSAMHELIDELLCRKLLEELSRGDKQT